jgi:putative transposase
MSSKRHKPVQIISKPREAEVELGKGNSVVQASRKIGITEQTHYRWRKKYGGFKLDQAKRLKELEKENSRLKKLLSSAYSFSRRPATATLFRPPTSKILLSDRFPRRWRPTTNQSVRSILTCPKRRSPTSANALRRLVGPTKRRSRIDRRARSWRRFRNSSGTGGRATTGGRRRRISMLCLSL